MGGNWLTTNPKAEQEAMRKRNRESKGLLFDTCKHLRRVRNEYFSSYKLPGIVIDSFVYHNIKDWYWLPSGRKGRKGGNSRLGMYEKMLYDRCPSYWLNLTAPGSGESVETSKYLDILKKVLKYIAKD